MRRRAGGQALEQVSIVRIHDEEAAVRHFPPPAGWNVKFIAVSRDTGTVATEVVLAFPDNFLRFQIERAKATVGGRVINRVAPGIAAKPAQPFLERNINAPHKAVAVVDFEDQNSFAGTAFLRTIGRAQVEKAFQTGPRLNDCTQRNKGGEEEKDFAHD